MKDNLSPKAIAGALSAVVLLAATGLFLGLRDKPPTKEVHRDSAAKQAPPPVGGPMPDWALAKLHAAEGH